MESISREPEVKRWNIIPQRKVSLRAVPLAGGQCGFSRTLSDADRTRITGGPAAWRPLPESCALKVPA